MTNDAQPPSPDMPDRLTAWWLDLAPSRQEELIVAGDPYTVAGVGADHVLRPWNVVIPAQSS